VDRRNQIVLISNPSGETTAKLPFVTDRPSDQGKQGKKKFQATPP
jgi:hypothetical protein